MSTSILCHEGRLVFWEMLTTQHRYYKLKYLNLLKQNEWKAEEESEVKQKNHLKLVLQDSAEWG